MSGNRRLWLLLAIVLLLVLGLGLFYVWLTGGLGAGETVEQEPGLVSVRSIYVYADGRPLIKPIGLGSDSAGGFFVTLRDNATIVEFSPSGEYVRHWGQRGMRPGDLLVPIDVAVDRLAGQVYVVDRSRLRLIAYDPTGTYLWEVPVLTPTAVEVTENGDVLVATFGPLARYSSQGQWLGEIGGRGRAPTQFDFPRQIAAGEGGTVYVADSNNARVIRLVFSLEETSTPEWIIGAPPAQAPAAGFGSVAGIYTNPTGVTVSPRGLVVVLDSFKHIMQMLDPATGEELVQWGTDESGLRGSADGTFNLPTMITHLRGDEYGVTDTYNDRVQIIRLVEPGRRNPFTLHPWLRWLLLLLLLPLLWLFGRKRAFISEETLDRALAEGNARLLIAVFSKLHVLPSVLQQYEERTEGEVRLGDYLVPAEVKPRRTKVKKGEPEPEPERIEDLTPEQQLARAAEKTMVQKLLLARHFVVGADEDQCERFADLEASVMAYEQLLEEYEVEGGRPSDTDADDVGSAAPGAPGTAPDEGATGGSEDS